ARHLFDAIPQPTTVLWNTLIIGYICNGIPLEAISLYSRMLCSGVKSHDGTKCDSYTLSSALKACAETRQLLTGKALHCHVLRFCAYPSRIVYNSLLNMYATCLPSFECDLVKRVFSSMRKRDVISRNTMISWYAKSGRFVEAVGELVMMMKTGLRPTVVSFLNVLPALSGFGDVHIARAVHGMVTKFGEEYVKDLFIVSTAITMYAELGCLDFAREIFDDCSDKNAHVWNAMMGAYVSNSFAVNALELFLEALESDSVDNTDEVTFVSALAAASDLQDFDIVQQLHGYLVKSSSVVSSVVLLNAVMSSYSRCNSVEDSLKLFGEIRERDVVSWNTIICALVHNELRPDALMLIYEMQKQGFRVDCVTITALFSIASNLGDIGISKQVHGYFIRHGIKLNGAESYLIDMYSRSGSINAAERIFESTLGSHIGDLAVWNSMISGYARNDMIEEALASFRRMLLENMVPNSVTVASILPLCSRFGGIGLGKKLHCFALRSSLDGNLFVASGLVDMYSKCGAIRYAERVFESSPEKNSVTYTNMMLGYGQHGMSDEALTLFHSMKRSGVDPDSVTFVAALSACSYGGLISEGLDLFRSMETEQRIKPSIEHLVCVVDMLGKAGRLPEAYEFAEKLEESGDFFEIWGSLLASCRVHREVELGKVVADKILSMEKKKKKKNGDKTGRSPPYRVLMRNMLAEEGKWENAMDSRKEAGCSWIDVRGEISCFVSGEKNHPRKGEIYELL
ncbi:hypothetical protein M569_14234, partial [Genlisea aurea]